jgi:pimeloyl-ACP methyl ester carboxylesterase
LSFGKDQIAKDIHKSEWQEIVTYAEAHVPDYTYETSIGLNTRASSAEGYIDDIFHVGGGINNLLKNKTAFSFFWFLSNAGATYFSGLNQKIMYAEYSTKLKLIKLPLLCITGKYDFTVPRGLADEVMQKVASTKKKLVILPHSGHIVMDSEPDAFYGEIIKFVEANK